VTSSLVLATAWAAGGGHGAAEAAHGSGGSNMATVLFLLAVVIGAYMLAHFVVEQLQRTYLLVTGVEYMVLGVFLGPNVMEQVHPFTDLRALGPVFAFAAGWIGLLYGMELNLRSLLASADRSIRLALADALVTGAGTTALAVVAFQAGWLVEGVHGEQAWPAAMLLGCAAGASSSSAVDLIRARYPDLQTQLLPTLRRTARLGDLFAIAAFGLVFCFFHEGRTLLSREPVWAEWLLISVGLGLVLGVVFMTFLSEDSEGNDAFLAMIGILLFASGAAFFLHISALLVNLVLGVVVVQTAKGLSVRAQLERTEKPVKLVLLLFAGALWTPVPAVPALVACIGYVALRVITKAVGSYLATLGTPLRGDIFRGLLAQGNVAVAMAVSMKLVYHGPAVDLAYTAVLFSVALHEIVAPRMLRGLLVDAGELRQDVLPTPSQAQGGG